MRAVSFTAVSLALVLEACAHGGSSSGPTTPSAEVGFADAVSRGDERAFTRAATARLASLLPDARVEALEEPRTVRVERDGRDLVVSLDRPFYGCEQTPSDCDAITEGFLAYVAQAIARPDEDERATPERLRLAVRARDVVAMYQQRSGDALVTAPIVADLVGLVVVDFPESARPLRTTELTDLGLDAAAAIERARENVLAEIGPLVVPTIPERGAASIVALATERYYESSQILDASRFASLAAALGGTLYVAVPAVDTVLVLDPSAPMAAATLASIARDIAEQSDHPVSVTVLVWSNGAFTALR